LGALTVWEIAYCTAVLLVAYSLRGSTGFGGLVGMPLLALVIPVKVLAPAWTLLGIASAATLLGGGRAYGDKRAFVAFLPWCIVGIGAGLYLFKTLDALMLARALGVLVLLYAAYMTWLIARPASRDPLATGALRPVAGVLSGVVGTMFGAMASIFFAMYLNACALEKQAFRATISAMLLALSLIRLFAYAAVGELSAEALVLFAAALPAMGLGIYLGGRIHARMSEALFKALVCAILVICAISLLLR